MSKSEFDRFAERYREIHVSNIRVSGEEPEYFARYKMLDFSRLAAELEVPGDGFFLDFGSGIGNSVTPFFDLFPRAHLYAADVSAASLERLKVTYGSLVETVHITGDSIDLPSAILSGAFACCVFHHIDHALHATALRELRRVLRPGAPLMIYEHNPLNPLTVRAVRTCPLDVNARLVRASVMRRNVIDAGFRDARIEFRVFFPASLKKLRPMEDRMRWLPLGAQYLVAACA